MPALELAAAMAIAWLIGQEIYEAIKKAVSDSNTDSQFGSEE